MRRLALAAAALAAADARAECPADPLAETQAAAAAMEQAFLDLDDAGFTAARAAVATSLPCVDTPLEKRDVFALHVAMGLALFVDGDMRGSEKSWSAVKALRPEWVLPEEMAPPDHLLRQVFDRSAPHPEVVTLDLAPVNGWLVDGTWTSDVPAQRAFVLQALGAQGVAYTGYELTVAGIPLDDLVQPGPSPATRRARVVGTSLAVALGAGALGSMAVYVQSRGALDEVPYDRIDATGARANTAGGLAIGLGSAAVGAFAVSWAVRW